MSTPRKKKEKWKPPSLTSMILVMLFGLFMSHFTFTVTIGVYLSAIVTLVGLPLACIFYEDRLQMEETRRLIRILEGAE